MLDAVIDGLPVALGFILLASYILIFMQVRSVILPLKAIVMNILSVSASFGVLVWVFQMGNGAELMNFTPQPIDPTTPVMIFAILYGLSMDYEVLMLSRIHEEWERTGDNNKAVAVGLQKSGRIITSAGAGDDYRILSIWNFIHFVDEAIWIDAGSRCRCRCDHCACTCGSRNHAIDG